MGWNNLAFERAADSYETSLDRAERDRSVVEMMRIVSEELPVKPGFYKFYVVAHRTDLEGILEGGSGWNWNMHEWQWK